VQHDAAGAAPDLGAILNAFSPRHSSRSTMLPAARLTRSVGGLPALRPDWPLVLSFIDAQRGKTSHHHSSSRPGTGRVPFYRSSTHSAGKPAITNPAAEQGPVAFRSIAHRRTARENQPSRTQRRPGQAPPSAPSWPSNNRVQHDAAGAALDLGATLNAFSPRHSPRSRTLPAARLTRSVRLLMLLTPR
jgi:hypothetical protein